MIDVIFTREEAERIIGWGKRYSAGISADKKIIRKLEHGIKGEIFIERGGIVIDEGEI